jgi:inner membrane protein YidH
MMRGMAAEPTPTPRRTWLAAERTFLAWWRTGLAAAVAALGVGRVLPDVVDGATWPFVALGLGYGIVAGGIFLAGARRQSEIEAGLTGQEFRPLGHWMSMALTLAGVALTLTTLLVIALGP